ncbi:MAG: class I SAM-dependent methyltransferase [Polyangia bacterium]
MIVDSVEPAQSKPQRTCVLCQSTRFDPLPSEKLAHLCKCAGCGLVSVRNFPEPEQLRAIYSADYFKNSASSVMGYDDYEQDRQCIARTAARRLVDIEKKMGPGRLLDVGCALGFFIEEAQRRGWTVEGIDISAHAARYAADKVGVPARVGLLRDAQFEKGSFDAITMWDVIEHVADPVAELALCRELLRPGGLLVLSTPDVGSLVAKVTGPRWMGFKLAEEHLYYFSRQTMARSLEKAGFEIIDVTGIGKDVALDFFARRLGMYLPAVSGILGRAFKLFHLDSTTVYVNPHDIMQMVVRRP